MRTELTPCRSPRKPRFLALGMTARRKSLGTRKEKTEFAEVDRCPAHNSREHSENRLEDQGQRRRTGVSALHVQTAHEFTLAKNSLAWADILWETVWRSTETTMRTLRILSGIAVLLLTLHFTH